ncbi:MAG: hypothetical protein AAF420_05265, partial [Pseudomonadota bacterium]
MSPLMWAKASGIQRKTTTTTTRHSPDTAPTFQENQYLAIGNKPFTKWEDLSGKKVCGKQGAFYNQIVEERYGVEVVAFTGNAEAKQALRDRKC